MPTFFRARPTLHEISMPLMQMVEAVSDIPVEDVYLGRLIAVRCDRRPRSLDKGSQPQFDAAIERGLKRVEAGAQGEHKLARGYQPTPTVSAHYIPDPRFRRAVADYLEHERAMISRNIEELDELGPFKRG